MLIVPSNIVAPTAVTLVFYAPALGFDLTTVTAVNANVLRRDQTQTTFAFTIVSQTQSELTAQYVFSAGGTEITTPGAYIIAPTLTVAGGTIAAESVAMMVTSPFHGTPRLIASAWVVGSSLISGPGGGAITALTADVTAVGPGSVPATVVGIRGAAIPPLSNGSLISTGGILSWAAGGGGGITALTGDVTASGTGSVAATAVRINGATVPAAGALTVGNILQVSGASALVYAALNLAGGAGYVTGALPAANQAPQTMAGDVTGVTNASVVARVNGATAPAAGALTTGNVLQVSGASALTYAAVNLAGGAGFVTGVLPTGNQAAQAMVGDVTGTTAASVVSRVNGATVPAAGALVTGNAAYVSGASALTYSALNLAGGSGWVTGTLPTANQALQAMAGDVTGTTGASVVSKANGATIPASGALTTGNVLQVSGVSALTYAAVNLAGGAGFVTGVLPTANQASQTMGGDVTGTTAASVVGKINAGQGQFATATTDFLGIGGPASGAGQVSATGYIRLNGAGTNPLISMRNGSNTGNLTLLTTDGGDNVSFGPSGVGICTYRGLITQVASNGGTWIFGAGVGPVLEAQQASTTRTVAASVANALSVFAGASTTSGNNGAALRLGGGASGGGAGLRGATNISVGSAVADTLLACAEVVQNNRVLALCQGAALTSTQMPANTGDRVGFWTNAATAPTANPVGGFILYGDAGGQTNRGSSGTTTAVSPA